MYFFRNSGVNTLTTGTVPLPRRVSSIEAARLHSVESVFTVTDLGPVTSLAWHLLPHMNTSGVQASPAVPTM